MSESKKMPENILNKLMQEIGADDPESVAKIIDTESSGTVLGLVIQSGKSLVMQVYQKCLDFLWGLVRSVLAALLPQLFLRYATGTYLEEYAKDHGLERHPGQFTILPLECTKDAGTSLTLYAGDVFYIVEQEPRRYQVLEETEIDEAATEFQINVEALAPSEVIGDITYIYSKAYNPATGLTWACEEALPINTIEFAFSDLVQTGENPEEDDTLRDRVYALKSLEVIETGIDLYYENLLKTVALVSYVTLDEVDPVDATLTYTIYGASGELTSQTQEEAQIVFDAGKMRTDKGLILLATAYPLAISISRTGGGTENEIINAVNNHFLELNRGADFEACDLYNTLDGLWPDMITRIVPQNIVLPPGRYFVPNTTIQEI